MTPSDLDKFCTSLKGTTKDVKWGNDLCYCVGKKMYCVTNLKGDAAISLKTSPEDFSILTERNGIIPASYAARYHWIMVNDLHALKPKEWKDYIQKSYDLVFEKLSKKIRTAI